ncbi:hypothetical protein KCP69_10050 [Salmonella enterica subsp. enterica]|nr:hypothetical protein KCP69_10050 [Salmonella enterica subsp. enterica]
MIGLKYITSSVLNGVIRDRGISRFGAVGTERCYQVLTVVCGAALAASPWRLGSGT